MNTSKKQEQRSTLRGFTLIEMVVVIAIIAILLTVFVPAIAGYMTRSRLNAANSNAKVLFNSAQTICQEYEFADRSASSSVLYGANSTGEIIAYSPENSSTMTVTAFNADFGADTTQPGARFNVDNSSSFRGRLSRLFMENNEVCWLLVIQDYQVRAAFCATTGTTEYIGAYPTKFVERNGFGDFGDNETLGTISDTTVPTHLATLESYISSAWNTTFTFS